jgi:hypothetical protein
LCCLLILVLGFLIGCYGIHESGALWPDGPRYANGAAMIHDWLKSGDLFHPYEFAKQNYARYPAFSIPYHPPAYPALLALFFLATGISYFWARVFVAGMLSISALLFYALARRGGITAFAALACTAVFLTTPGIAHWARDTMSEVPSLALALAASVIWLQWLHNPHPRNSWLAFFFAELAFMSRVTTVAILPVWFVMGIVMRRLRLMCSINVILAGVLYLGVNLTYLALIAGFNCYEISADGRAAWVSWTSLRSNLAYFGTVAPSLACWRTSLIGIVGAFNFLRVRGRFAVGWFWACWLLSFLVFKILVPTSPELRHLFGVFPALAGLSTILFSPCAPAILRRRIGPALVAVGIVMNVSQLQKLPQGVVGYGSVAQRLAKCSEPGNILLACEDDQDLIFRFRACQSDFKGRVMRSDRMMAIRVAGYAGVSPRPIAEDSETVLSLLQRGRVRYLVTCVPSENARDDRANDIRLAHDVATQRPQHFEMFDSFPIRIDYGGRERCSKVFLWRFKGELPSGPCDIPVVIPTAGMEYRVEI